jgi:hypothetical protein
VKLKRKSKMCSSIWKRRSKRVSEKQGLVLAYSFSSHSLSLMNVRYLSSISRSMKNFLKTTSPPFKSNCQVTLT